MISKKIVVTGGCGYVGSVLVPMLIKNNFKVTVIDLEIYGNHLKNDINLDLIKGDIRDKNLLDNILKNHDTVLHMACISNDPSFELNPTLGKSINLDAFIPLVEISKKNKIKKFIYASSSSVYGIKSEENVTEEMSLNPLTDYSKFKAECEKILDSYISDDFACITVRPATVCGFSPRQRLDVIVNILTNLAYHKREISIFGGDQLRPNIHIIDLCNAYIKLLKSNIELINGHKFNVGGHNYSVNEIANRTKKIIGEDVKLVRSHSDDNRSYHISSQKIQDKLNFKLKYNIDDAIQDLKKAFEEKYFSNPLENELYFNIKRMQNINLK